MFVDVVNGSRGFSCTKAQLDADGWPTVTCQMVLGAAVTLAAGPNGIDGAQQSASSAYGNVSMGDIYQFKYDKVLESSQLTVPTAQGTIVNTYRDGMTQYGTLEIKAIVCILDIVGAIRNLKIVRPGYSIDTEQIFMPRWLNYIKQFGSIRFMEAQGMTGGTALNQRSGVWTDRATPVNAHGGYYVTAVHQELPLEYCIAMCNQARTQPASSMMSMWTNIVHTADQNYVTKYCEMLRDTLDPSLIIYLELGNECWNGLFACYNYFLNMGADPDAAAAATWYGNPDLSYDGSQDVAVLRMRAYARKTFDMALTARAVFGTSEFNRRVRVIMSGQGGGLLSYDQLKYLSSDPYYASEPIPGWLFAIANAAYYGVTEVDVRNSTTVSDIVTKLSTYANTNPLPGPTNGARASTGTIPWTAFYKEIATMYGVRTVAYEGGPDNVGLSTSRSLNLSLLATLSPQYVDAVKLFTQKIYDSSVDVFEWFKVDPGPFPVTNGNAWWAITQFYERKEPKLAGLLAVNNYYPMRAANTVARLPIRGDLSIVPAYAYTKTSPGDLAGGLSWQHVLYVPSYAITTSMQILPPTNGTGFRIAILYFVVFVQDTGLYKIESFGTADLDNPMEIKLDGVSIGTDTLPAKGYRALDTELDPNLNQDAKGQYYPRALVHVPNFAPVTIQQGWHTIEYILYPPLQTAAPWNNEKGGTAVLHRLEVTKVT
jgi:hypothetical protein